jgi:hypothetical protein
VAVRDDRAARLAGWAGLAACGFGASTVTGGSAAPDCAATGPICMLNPNTVAQKKPFDTVPHADGLKQSNFIRVESPTVPRSREQI